MDGVIQEFTAISHEGDSPNGRLLAKKFADGSTLIEVEEWIESDGDPMSVAVVVSGVVLDIEKFRKFLAWGQKVAG